MLTKTFNLPHYKENYTRNLIIKTIQEWPKHEEKEEQEKPKEDNHKYNTLRQKTTKTQKVKFDGLTNKPSYKVA